MTDAEKHVREAWDDRVLSNGLYIYEGKRLFEIRLGHHTIKGETKNKESAWQAALAFTLERKEQIRLKEEEIRLAEYVAEAARECANEDIAPSERILAVLQAQLTELKKGMKEQSNGK